MHSNPQDLLADDYIHTFKLARNIKRHHRFYLGPTNSGKTYQALQTLERAQSGVTFPRNFVFQDDVKLRSQWKERK